MEGKTVLKAADAVLDFGSIVAAVTTILRTRAEKYSEQTAERHQAAETMRGRLERVLQSIPPEEREALDRRYDQSMNGWPIGHWRAHPESDFAMLILKMLPEDKSDDEWSNILRGLNDREDKDFWRAMERLDHAPNVESFHRVVEAFVGASKVGKLAAAAAAKGKEVAYEGKKTLDALNEAAGKMAPALQARADVLAHKKRWRKVNGVKVLEDGKPPWWKIWII